MVESAIRWDAVAEEMYLQHEGACHRKLLDFTDERVLEVIGVLAEYGPRFEIRVDGEVAGADFVHMLCALSSLELMRELRRRSVVGEEE